MFRPVRVLLVGLPDDRTPVPPRHTRTCLTLSVEIRIDRVGTVRCGTLRDLYQTPGFGETTHRDHITEHYYTTHPDVSPKRIVPVGPDPDFEPGHDRSELPGEPPV